MTWGNEAFSPFNPHRPPFSHLTVEMSEWWTSKNALCLGQLTQSHTKQHTLKAAAVNLNTWWKCSCDKKVQIQHTVARNIDKTCIFTVMYCLMTKTFTSHASKQTHGWQRVSSGFQQLWTSSFYTGTFYPPNPHFVMLVNTCQQEFTSCTRLMRASSPQLEDISESV